MKNAINIVGWAWNRKIIIKRKKGKYNFDFIKEFFSINTSKKIFKKKRSEDKATKNARCVDTSELKRVILKIKKNTGNKLILLTFLVKKYSNLSNCIGIIISARRETKNLIMKIWSATKKLSSFTTLNDDNG